jgi:hypothetical protein
VLSIFGLEDFSGERVRRFRRVGDNESVAVMA